MRLLVIVLLLCSGCVVSPKAKHRATYKVRTEATQKEITKIAAEAQYDVSF